MNGNPLDKVKRTFGCLQLEKVGQISRKILSCIAKGFVLVYEPKKKNKTIESPCSFKVWFAEGKAHFPLLNRLTHIVIKILHCSEL